MNAGKIMDYKDIEIHEIVEIAKQAGIAILEIYEKDFSVNYKDDKSPLTEADIASHNIIINALKKYGYPILSEEAANIPYTERAKWHYYWLVDPLDGTKEFVKRNGEFTVNIALLKDNKPVLGVIYVPVKNISFYAKQGEGAYKIDNGEQKLPIDYKRKKFTVVASRSHFSDATKKYVEKLEKQYGEIELISAGSSLKFCLVAEGKADVYPRFAPTMEWDTAAAHAIVNEAGKKVLDWKTKEDIPYNKENLRNGWFIVE